MPSKSDLYDAIPVFGLMAWTILTQYIPEEFQMVWTWSGFGAIIGFMFLVDLAYLWKTAPYLYVEAILNPRLERFRFYVKKPIQTVDLENNQYQTVFNLPWPTKHPYYGDVESVVVLHSGPREERIEFQPGKAMYAGNEIDHSQTCFMVLQDRGGVPERGEPEPIFDLVWSTGDVDKPVGRKTETTPRQDVDFLRKHVPGFELSEEKLLEDFQNRLDKAETALLNEKREKLKYMGLWKRDKRKRMTAEESFGSQKEETDIALGMSGKVREMAQDVMLSFVEAHGSIEAGLKALAKPKKVVIGKYVAAMVVSLGVLAYFAYYPSKLDQIMYRTQSLMQSPSSQLFLLMFAIVIGGALYYWKWGRK